MRTRGWMASGAAGTSAAVLAIMALRRARRARRLELHHREIAAALAPPSQIHATVSQIVKPTPRALFVDRGTGTMYETRLQALDDFLVPSDRFFVRSHGPTPRIDVRQWRLGI